MSDLSNENIIHVKKAGLEYLQFKKLLQYDDIIKHAYSLGIDKNFRTARADTANPLTKEEFDNAIRDYKMLSDEIGIDYINIVKPNQAHTKNIKRVNEKVKIYEPDFNLDEYSKLDGLMTNKKNIALATTNADCILLLFFDPVKKVVANIHSGWRGTLQRISVETVKQMCKEYGCEEKDIICCICPSIRKCHFKVHKDVKEPFYNEFKDLKEIEEIIVPVPDEDRWSIDTVKINQVILEQAGLKQENIIDCGICSVCNSDLIHSFRVEKQGYGLATAIISKI